MDCRYKEKCRNYCGRCDENTCYLALKEINKELQKENAEQKQKQIPKKIFHRQWVGIDGVPYDLCPTCKTNLCTDGFMPNKKENYCANCGQKLDWSADDE